MTFKERIEAGLAGNFQGLKDGFTRLGNYVFGVQRATYYLFGGNSGSGKTTLVDFILLNALNDAIEKGIKINVFYYSYEINEISKKANWLSQIIYGKYKKVITPEKIKGLGDNRLTEEEKKIVDDEIPHLEELFSMITWIFEPQNPTGMYKAWWTFMNDRGTFIKEPYVDEEGKSQERIVRFVPNDPDEYNLIVVDHIALCKTERNYTLKENLDKLSTYAIRVRNLFGMTSLFLQQYNMGLSSVDRQKFKGVDISPQQSDFKDSTNPFTDADVVLGLMNAYRMDLTECIGYNLLKLKDRFRLLKIIKNRNSRDNIALGLYFMPEAGIFKELPEADKMTVEIYNKITNNK